MAIERRSIIRTTLMLGLLGLAVALAVVFVREWTAERIVTQQTAAQREQLKALLPEQIDNAAWQLQATSLPDAAALGFSEAAEGWQVLHPDTKKIVAVVLPVRAPDGYNGAIDLLLGVDRDSRVLGVRVIAHGETPGLGDKIERRKSDWITHFSGRSLSNSQADDWQVRKYGGDFDAFTGATITPQAVVRAIHDALLWQARHHEALFTRTTRIATEEQ